MLAKLRPAALVWIGDVLVSGALGYLGALYWGGLGPIEALVVATALTATSIGVATAAWENAGVLQTTNGRLMLNVAELDDISGVLLMALLFAVVPVLNGGNPGWWSVWGTAALAFVAKFVLFAGLLLVLARYLEAPLTRLAFRGEPATQRMLTVVGLGLVISGIARWLGFSLAIGALLTGLLFSRDPKAVRTEARFTDLYAFFAPFFFVGIGLNVDFSDLGKGHALLLALLLAGVVGKLIGNLLPALLVTDLCCSRRCCIAGHKQCAGERLLAWVRH